MINKTFQVSVSGDIMRKVTALVNLSTCCECQVFVSTPECQICADSLMGLLSLFAAAKDEMITVSVDGVEEQDVMEKIVMVFDSA